MALTFEKLMDKLTPEQGKLLALQGKVKQKYPELSKTALLGTRQILREMPMNSPDFDEKEFWTRLDEKMNSETKQGDYHVH